MTSYLDPSVAEEDPAESFKPVNFEGWAALVFKPIKKAFVTTPEGRRLEVITALTAFETEEEILIAKPTEEYNYLIAWGRIASVLNRAFVADLTLLGRVRKGKPPREGQRPAWMIADLDPETKLSVISALQRLEDADHEAAAR